MVPGRFFLDAGVTNAHVGDMSNRIMVIAGHAWADRHDVTFVRAWDLLELCFLEARVSDCERDQRQAWERALAEIDQGRTERANMWLRHSKVCCEAAAYWRNRISELTSPEYVSACNAPVGTPHG